jgi:hypothetical protein
MKCIINKFHNQSFKLEWMQVLWNVEFVLPPDGNQQDCPEIILL